MVDTLHIIVQFTPECFSKFHGYLQNNHENIEEEEEGILQYISDESNNADMHENGCIVSIEDNELAMEEGGPINDLIRDDTQQYMHFVEPCNPMQGGKKKSKRRKTNSKRRTKRRKRNTKKRTHTKRKKRHNKKKKTLRKRKGN